MKKTILTIGLITFGLGLCAQSNKEDIELIQAAYGKDKKELMAEVIQLDGKQKEQFWKLYDEYETARKKLGKKRVAIIEKYAAHYDTLSEQKMDEIMKESLALASQNDKLIETYYHKIKKVSGVKAAAQWSEVESYLLSKVRIMLMENIPFIGEIEDKD